ncbi:MAG: VWA domain-containing protein [Acidobacteria bacterium]|nr:VWA domain-containing protein [Acidobacteriota bacterium]MCG3194457.1 hypothetical protein [Thermoanaerobaculia bacterium]
MRTSRALFLCILFAVPFSGPVRGTDPPAMERVPGIRAAVEVTALDLDIIATGKDGKPVGDLRKEEVSLSVDGKVLPLDYFTRIDAGTLHGPDLGTASPDLILETMRDAEGSRFVPRQFLIFFDDEHLLPWERKPILEGLRDFVTRLSPSDSVSVVAYNASARVVVPYTSSKEEILAGFSKIEKTMPRGLVWDNDFKASVNELRRSPGPASRQAVIRSWSEQVRAREAGTLEELRRAVSALSGRSGKRALIYVSRGLELRPGQTLVQSLGPNLISQFDYSVHREFNAVIEEANKSGITIHSLDGKGLMTDATGADMALPPPNISQFYMSTNLRQGLSMLAESTGGILVTESNTFGRSLDTIYRESSSYYSVGVTLANLDPKKKSFDVKVKSTRPGVKVRTRQTYGVRTPEDSFRDRSEMALVTPSAKGDFSIEFEMGAPVKGGGLGRRLIPFTVRIPIKDLTFTTEAGQRKALVDLTVAAIEDTGAKSKINPTRVPVVIPEADWQKAGGEAFVYKGEAKSGTGNIRFVASVRDAASERIAFGSTMLRVE